MIERAPNKSAGGAPVSAALGGRLPDFLIVGAMKSGTSSLQHILDQHPHVYMPGFEIFFFDIDDIQQHPDFFRQARAAWSTHDYERSFDENLCWYRSLFAAAQLDQLVGERSTTYIASQTAAPRIASLLPDAKLIFMLRDPVARAYSQYWHLVRTGRAIYDFEKSIQYVPETILQRSLYKSQIERYRQCISQANMSFIIFEEFIADVQGTVDRVCAWLGLHGSVDTRSLDTRKNVARVPRSLRLQLCHNRLFRGLAAQRYTHSHLPNMPSVKANLPTRAASRLVQGTNLRGSRPVPPMKASTREFLATLFAKENRGLSRLIGKDVREYWPYMEE